MIGLALHEGTTDKSLVYQRTEVTLGLKYFELHDLSCSPYEFLSLRNELFITVCEISQ